MPRTSNISPISTPAEPKKRTVGRPAALEMPPIPQEILAGMTELEQQHFEHFRQAYYDAYKRHYGKITPTAEISITQAALDYVHLWRLQAEQMSTGKLVSQARQHPGTGKTPGSVQITCNSGSSPGSQTQGVSSLTSTNCYVTSGNGYGFYGLALAWN